jgi:hypothetical protein
MRITPTNLEMLESFEKYCLLALCEELALVGDRKKIFEILNVVYSVERWSLKSFKRFMSSIKNSELLSPLYDGIFDLHENCKNYMKTM